jgi:hypothetical protein
MPTVKDPDTKPQPNTPQNNEPELFAAEIEMEKKSSGFWPAFLILALVAVVGGTIYYFYRDATRMLSKSDATVAVNNILKQQAPSTIRFTTGKITSTTNDKPADPHYKLLAKAGIINTRPMPGGIFAEVTPAGQKMFELIGGVQKTENKDHTVTYRVPLAQRKLVSIDNIEMIHPEVAQVTYSWQWEPNRLGKQFDASGDLVKSFSTWDRTTLITSYGVDFFGKAPTKVTVKLREDKSGGWVPFIE